MQYFIDGNLGTHQYENYNDLKEILDGLRQDAMNHNKSVTITIRIVPDRMTSSITVCADCNLDLDNCDLSGCTSCPRCEGVDTIDLSFCEDNWSIK